MKKIKEHFSGMSNTNGNISATKMWNLKNKLIPKNFNIPMAKKNKEGDLITSPRMLQKLCLDTFLDRLSPNIIKPELAELKKI